MTHPLVRRRGVLAAAGAVALGGSAAALRARSAPTPVGSLRLLTGGTLGVYYRFGQALADQMQAAADGLRVTTESSSGSVQNLLRLAGPDAGATVVAFVAADAAALAVRGQRPFRDVVRVGALARLYDDYLHLVTRPGSGIKKVADLTGRRFSIGPDTSGTALIAQRVLKLAGVGLGRSTGRSTRVEELPINESVEALESGDIDAFFWSGGVPTTGVSELARKTAISLVPMEREATAMYAEYGRPYRVGTVPPGVYGLKVPVGTLAVPNLLVTPTATPPATVLWIDALLFGSRTAIGRKVTAANTLDARTAISVAPVGLHPGAVDYFRTHKP